MPLTIVPRNPVACGSLLIRVGEELRAVVLVKATFSLAHERSAWPIEPEPLALVDEHVGGHPTNPLVAATDLTPPLPGAGVVFHATAHAPGGQPVSEMAVRVAVFQDGAAMLNKHLRVIGDRSKGGEPTPFTRMPIVYERTAGGPAMATNPAGIGASGGARPNIVDPARPDKPAGFGPIAPTWAPRAAPMRRFASAPREDEVTIFPADASFEPFHAAPADQRLEALRGDEWIVLDGLNAERARVQTQLPFARALARYEKRGAPGFAEIPLVGDTLTVDTDRLTASVVWRGHLVVSSREEARALVVFAALEVPTLSIDWPAPSAEPQRAPSKEWPDDIPDTTSERDVTAIRAAIAADWGHAADLERTAEIDERLASSAPLPFRPGATPLVVAPLAPEIRIANASTGTVDVEQSVVRRSLAFAGARGGTLGRARAAWLERVAAAVPIAPPMAKGDAAPEDDPTADVRARAEARNRAGRSLGDLPLAGADLSNADLTGADLQGLDLSGARLAGAKLGGAKLGRADLSRAVLDGATLDGADLTDAKLQQARGRDARLVGVRGARAAFTRADWDGANFSDAELDAADFTAASLAQTRFLAASLREARFVDARGATASFEGAHASGAKLAGAVLRGASFRLAELEGAAFDGAELAEARLDGARLEKASLFRAGAIGARFAGADLRGANLGRVVASKADLAAADLRGADLRNAKLDGATFEEATLRDAQATLADLSQANLARCDLSNAVLREANLAEADLSQARLDNADLRDANLSGATLTGSSRRGAKMQGARMTGVTDDR